MFSFKKIYKIWFLVGFSYHTFSQYIKFHISWLDVTILASLP